MKARVVCQLFYKVFYSKRDVFFSGISEKSSGLSGGAKAGIAIGVLLLLGLCIFGQVNQRGFYKWGGRGGGGEEGNEGKMGWTPGFG